LTLRSIAVAILVLVLVSVCAAPASAADITITFEKGQVRTKMVLYVYQNMTRFPTEAATLDGSRDANMSSAIEKALKDTNSSASFSTLNMNLASSATWLNLTLTMDLAGISVRRGDIAYANMTWKAFRTRVDLRIADFSYNTVGSKYFRPVLDFYVNASRFEQTPNATIKAVTFFVNGTQSVAGTVAANSVGNFTVLDFSALNVPVEQWNRTYSISNNTTSWRYAPRTALNASVRVQELNKTFRVFSRYAYDAEIMVSGLAYVQGNMLRVDVGSGQEELIMTGVVVTALVLVIVVQILFRRRRKAVRLGRR
jgi:hypothetical protein